jgi:hypothetical protein
MPLLYIALEHEVHLERKNVMNIKERTTLGALLILLVWAIFSLVKLYTMDARLQMIEHPNQATSSFYRIP